MYKTMKRKYTPEEVNKLMHGRIYANTNDLNIFVKRKNGLCSWTMNLGNKWSWFIILLELIVIFSIVIILYRIL